MLKTRVITAIIMVVVVLGVVFALPNWAFAAVAAIAILGFGGWEAGRLAGFQTSAVTWAFAALLTLACGLLYLSIQTNHRMVWLGIVAMAWLVASGWLIRPQAPRSATIKLALLTLILSGAWLALTLLQAQSPWLIVLFLLVIASADIGAYFTGRTLGGPKLAPSISPGKTWSGALGGLTLALIMGPVSLTILPLERPFTLAQMAVLSLALASISIVGDLFISVLKRQVGLKDSSHLLPGHGGLLDRIDSLGAALPFFALALAWSQAQ